MANSLNTAVAAQAKTLEDVRIAGEREAEMQRQQELNNNVKPLWTHTS